MHVSQQPFRPPYNPGERVLCTQSSTDGQLVAGTTHLIAAVVARGSKDCNFRHTGRTVQGLILESPLTGWQPRIWPDFHFQKL